jgi:hypothetical protein
VGVIGRFAGIFIALCPALSRKLTSRITHVDEVRDQGWDQGWDQVHLVAAGRLRLSCFCAFPNPRDGDTFPLSPRPVGAAEFDGSVSLRVGSPPGHSRAAGQTDTDTPPNI